MRGGATKEGIVKVTVEITKTQALALLRSEGLTMGHGVRKSKALESVEGRIFDAVQDAWNADLERRAGRQ